MLRSKKIDDKKGESDMAKKTQHHKIHDLSSSKRCCQSSTVVGRLKDDFKEKKASFSAGADRAKGQPLTAKLTRGAFCGRHWFPFWNNNKNR